jgi:hypothetical protein
MSCRVVEIRGNERKRAIRGNDKRAIREKNDSDYRGSDKREG